MASIVIRIFIKCFCYDYLLTTVTLVICSPFFLLVCLYGSPSFSEGYEPFEMEALVLKLDYLSFLTKMYVKNGGNLPEGEKNVYETIKFLRKECDIQTTFVEYVQSLCDAESGDAAVSKLGKKLLKSTIDEKKEEYYFNKKSKYMGYDFKNDYCVFIMDAEKNIVLIGINSSQIVLTRGYQDYLRAILLSLDKEYYQDTKYTVYDRGQIIFTRLETANSDELVIEKNGEN